MSVLAETFAAARADGRAALIAYLPAGFPTPVDCVPVIAAMVENGVDAVEIGLPYSDPLMDGPVIQAAVDSSLQAGTRVRDVMKTVADVSDTGAPTLIMSYWNPIERYGVNRFASELASARGVGVITPDLTPEESGEWTRATDENGIDRVFLVAPSSTDARLEKVASACTGFVYAASTMGVTGARTSLSSGARTLVERVRDVTMLPICVGVGVSNADQASEVASYADGVIVGSAFVKALQEARSPAEGAAAAAALAGDLAAGVRAATRHA